MRRSTVLKDYVLTLTIRIVGCFVYAFSAEWRLNEKYFNQFVVSYYEYSDYIVICMADTAVFMVCILCIWSDILLLTLVVSLFHTFD